MTTYEIIENEKIVVIVRQLYGDNLLRLAHSLFAGGIRLMEVTFDQKDPNHLEKTSAAIRLLNDEFKDEMRFGVGTTLTEKHVTYAHQAGAQFIISPNSNKQVILKSKELGLISIPGAMTPTEILQASEWGADYIKIFPVGSLGLKFCKDIMAPINHLKLLATAGVSEENFGQLLSLGFAGAGISGGLTVKN